MSVRRAIHERPLVALAALALLTAAAAHLLGIASAGSTALPAITRPVGVAAMVLLAGALSALATSVLRVRSEE